MSPRHKHLLLFAALFLIGSLLHFPLALQAVVWKRGPKPRPTLNLFPPEAAAYPYPGPTPSDQPKWPPPLQYTEWSEKFGHKHVSIYAADPSDPDNVRFQVSAELYGWPLPVMIDQEHWWPWDHPTWKSKTISDPGMRVLWPGVFINPLLFAAAFWTLIAFPIFAIRRTRKFIHLRKVRSRHRKGLCPTCAYPVQPNTLCPECGPRSA